MIGSPTNTAVQIATLTLCTRTSQYNPASTQSPAPTLNNVRPRRLRLDIITPPAICRPALSRLISPSVASSAVNP